MKVKEYSLELAGEKHKKTVFPLILSNKRIRKWMKFICIGVLSAGLIFSGYMILDYIIGSSHDTKIEEDMRQAYYAAEPSRDKAAESIPDASIDAKANTGNGDAKKAYLTLKEINSEAIGWLHINGTAIDYPVAQADNNSYYLTHNIKKESSRHGCLFMDWRNSDGDFNTIIYGHDMKDGTFFGKLPLFLDEEYCKAHSVIQLNYKGSETQWQIFAVRKTDNSEVPAQFGSLTEYRQYIDKAIQSSVFVSGVKADENDSILTLSTCGAGDTRILVQAKKLPSI